MTRPSWTSRFAFLMAAIGFAVGLGNIWRFPYVTGENGGSAFVLVYLLCAFGIGVPILMAEIMIGRRGGMSPPNALKNVALAEGRSAHWKWLGHLNLLAAFLIEVVYCVIAGWVLLYLWRAITTGFAGVDTASAVASFDSLLADVGAMLFWTLLGLFLTGLVIYGGVRNGIERAVIFLMPLLFVLLLVLVGYNLFSEGFGQAVDYLFTPDFSKVNAQVVLAAIGQAFFSIGVAMAGMMTYGAYLPRTVSIGRSVWIVISADTAVALLAGLVIFPAVFRFGLSPDAGVGLIFHTLPVAFAQLPGGHWFAVAFFLLLAVAAITSMVGLIEPLTLWLEEKRGYARHKSAVVVLSIIGALSVLSILSYNLMAHWRVLGRSLNDSLDYIANQVMLPVGGLLLAVFAGWFISRNSARAELALKSPALFGLWRYLLRWVVPVALLVIFVMGIGGT